MSSTSVVFPDWTEARPARYSKHFRAETVPQLIRTRAFVSLYDPENRTDAQHCAELGAGLMNGLTFVLLVSPGLTPPAALRRAADIVIEDWQDSDANGRQLLAALKDRP